MFLGVWLTTFDKLVQEPMQTNMADGGSAWHHMALLVHHVLNVKLGTSLEF